MNEKEPRCMHGSISNLPTCNHCGAIVYVKPQENPKDPNTSAKVTLKADTGTGQDFIYPQDFSPKIEKLKGSDRMDVCAKINEIIDHFNSLKR